MFCVIAMEERRNWGRIEGQRCADELDAKRKGRMRHSKDAVLLPSRDGCDYLLPASTSIAE